MDLIGTTSSISFTRPITFGRKHHSPPYSIFCASLQGLHSNVTFPQNSQVRVPKLGLLLFQNFGRSYHSQIKSVLKVQGQYLIAFENIRPHLTPDFKGFIVESQIPNLTPTPSFDHNSCKLGLNGQWSGTLNIYVSTNF
jgi:hypothetical protein